jgi:hypothetical protein
MSSLYESNQVRVTSSVFETPGTQYPIRNIGAIKVYNYPIKFWTLGRIILTGLLLPVWGLGFLIIGYWAFLKFVLKRPEHFYGIIVVSAGSESKAYESSDRDEILQIQRALNDAIANIAA